MTIVERSLNPCCSGRWSGTAWIYSECAGIISLNPCCSGRWSGTLEFYNVQLPTQSLNPCCSGRWSGTWLDEGTAKEQAMEVLILVVVDDGLVPTGVFSDETEDRRLNPCCSGRWSGTWISID